MSEPVIKPFMVTMERGDDGKAFWREHFTRDDLVRVAVEIMQLAGCNACERSDVEAEVDRLTKGET